MIAALLLAAALEGPWQDWEAMRAVHTQGTGLRSVLVVPEMYARALPSLADVRVTDASGSEVPYAILARVPSPVDHWADAGLDDRGTAAGSYSQAVADTGSDLHDRYAIAIDTSRTDFSARVTIEASDDRITWRLIRASAPIYDYQQQGLDTHLTVTFPGTPARWLRVRIFADRQTPIDGIRYLETKPEQPELLRYGFAGVTGITHKDRHTIVTIDTRIKNLPVSLLRFATQTPAFSRAVFIESSDDGINWAGVNGEAHIRRVGAHINETSLPVDEVQARFWRIDIDDGNDRPLSGLRISLWGVPRHIVFEAKPGDSYRIVYANPQAAAPQYDFDSIHSPEQMEAAAPASLGNEQSAQRPPPMKPWSERHPVVLWSALALAILTIGGLAIRTLGSQEN